MKVIIFTGPTLSSEEGLADLNAIYLPPVSEGDVYRAALTQPLAIGVIDGYFESVPAVWHKEILWAMSQGIHVFGSASTGALRAAELEPFGMEGVGVIFEAYRDGALEDDDEVAVAHGPAETGYRVTSEAMVNIRFTMAEAEDAGVISQQSCAALVRIAKQLYYPERLYPLVLERAEAEGWPAQELAALRKWLPLGQVNQKRDDARAMLRVIQQWLRSDGEPKRVSYSFQHTEMWDAAFRLAGELQIDGVSGTHMIQTDALLDELRLEGESYVQARQATLGRLLALEEAARQGVAVNDEKLHEEASRFRRNRGLFEPGDLDRWLTDHHLRPEQFTNLIDEEARVRWVETVTEREVNSRMPDYLRVFGHYSRLVSRALDKQRTLESWALNNPALADLGLAEEELLRWYFESRRDITVPDSLEQYARSVGFADADLLRHALLREFCYVNRTSSEPLRSGPTSALLDDVTIDQTLSHVPGQDEVEIKLRRSDLSLSEHDGDVPRAF